MTDEVDFQRGTDALRSAFIGARMLRDVIDVAPAGSTRDLAIHSDRMLQRAIGALGAGLIDMGTKIGKSADDVAELVETLEREAETEELPDDVDE